MRKIALLAFIGLTLGLSGRAAKITSSTHGTFVVRAGFPDMGVEKALNLAESECGKRKLAARVRSTTSEKTNKYIFDCVRLNSPH